MKIRWIGHSCFKIEKDGYSVVFDPYQDGSVPGLSPVREEADLVLCSHDHHDHNAAACVSLRKKDRAQTEISLTKAETFHDEAQGTKRGANTIHMVEPGGEKAVHLGDIGCALTSEQAALLKGADVLFVPIGGFYTIDTKEAVKIVKALEPKVVVPMHFRDDAAGFGYEVIADAGEFKETVGRKILTPGCEFDTAAVPAGCAVVLTPANLT